MTQSIEENFPNVKRAYLAANSANYFLRKLREDTEVQNISARYDTAEIVAAIKGMLSQPPSSLDELVAPYALIAALGTKGPRAKLEEIAATPSPHHEWFQEIADKIVASWKSTIITTIQASAPQAIIKPSPIRKTPAITATIIIPGR